ncbi:MAG: glycosyltransferase [Bacteroidota bacterium]|nr:glycosyltransferase [Bacteroidota bacterium]
MPHRLTRNVIIAPLDWGLGHATRCIPIINALKKRGIQVLVAAGGPQKFLLQTEFPTLEFLEIPGYGIRLEGKGKGLVWSLIFRIPRILRSVRKEQAWLKTLCRSRPIDAVISDSRYGFYHSHIHSIFITHQLYIRSGLGDWANRILLKLNHHFINRFSECWVPDFQNADALAGILSHPPRLPEIPVKYCGILSRFKREKTEVITNPLLILISGPEPQRKLFENKILRLVEQYKGHAVLVRGLPGTEEKINLSNQQVYIYNHLASGPLNDLMNRSEFVICSSGYSTLMDLARLKKKAILIPTAGQPEQEYLGAYLHKKKWAFTVSLEDFDLERCIEIFHEETFGFPEFPDDLFLKEKVAEFLDNPLICSPG